MGEFNNALDIQNESTYNLLFRKLYKPLCFFAFKITNDTQKSEDIVQDCFLKLWISKKVFKKFELAQSYLYLSVKNACFDDLGRQEVKSKYDKTLISQDIISEVTTLDLIIQAEVLRKVLLAIDSLPPKCKEVIHLTYNEGKTPKEIADELGISVSTVTNQKLRGITILKERLSKSEYLSLIIFLNLQGLDIHVFMK